MKASLLRFIIVALLLNASCIGPTAPYDPPMAAITSPADGSAFTYSETITFTASAIDPKDSLLTDTSLVWISNKDGQLGRGVTLTTSSLSENSHVITLVTTDSLGDNDSTSITISINPNRTWMRVFGGRNEDYGNFVCETPDGGFITIGTTQSFGAGGKDVYLIKTDKNGTLVWERTIGGTGSDYGEGACETSDGGFMITGVTTSYIPDDYYMNLIKTDNDGIVSWERIIGTESHFSNSVCQTADGGYAITSRTFVYAAGNADVYLVKADDTGSFVWDAVYGGTLRDWPYCVSATSDGGTITTGYTYSFGAGGSDIYLIKTDDSGTLVWEKTFGGAGAESASSVVETSDGGYIIAGGTNSFGDGSANAYLIKTGSNGDLVWEKNFGGPRAGIARSVCETSDGGYVLTGRTYSYSVGGYDVSLIKTNSSGDLVWEKSYGGTEDELGKSVRQTADGGYIVTGTSRSFGAGGYDVYLLKTDSLGNVFGWEGFDDTPNAPDESVQWQ